MKKLLNGLFVAAAATMLATGCSESKQTETITLDRSTVSFASKEAEPQTVKVLAGESWKATTQESWITVTPGSGEFTVSVTDNDDATERRGSVLVSAEGYESATLSVSQLAATSDGTPTYRHLTEFFQDRAVISPMGNFIAGFITDVTEESEYTYQPVIIDLVNEEDYRLDPILGSVRTLDESVAVTDNGLAFYMSDLNTVSINLSNEMTVFPSPTGYTGTAIIYGCSSDGSVLVGTVMGPGEGMGKYVPLKYIDGVSEALPTTELNYRGMKSYGGVIARGCSIDGKIVYGTDWEDYNGGLCYWNADDNNEFHWVGEADRKVRKAEGMTDGLGNPREYNLVDGVQGWGSLYYLSPNGKWIAGCYTQETLADDKMTVYESYSPYFFDIENETGYPIDGRSGQSGVAVTDDGIGFITEKDMATSCTVINVRTGESLGSMIDWVKNEYGISVPGGFVNYLAPNKVLFGQRMFMDGTGGGPHYENWFIRPATL